MDKRKRRKKSEEYIRVSNKRVRENDIKFTKQLISIKKIKAAKKREQEREWLRQEYE